MVVIIKQSHIILKSYLHDLDPVACSENFVHRVLNYVSTELLLVARCELVLKKWTNYCKCKDNLIKKKNKNKAK